SLHLSGPLLFWLQRQHPDYLIRLRTLVESGVVAIVGGLVDESFAQLSTRPDDLLYQVAQYAALSKETLGVDPEQWQGFHLVEREAGELMLDRVGRAAREIGFHPIVYLDAETFFPDREPLVSEDLARAHFGYSSSGTRTTFPSLPGTGLHGLFRDQI